MEDRVQSTKATAYCILSHATEHQLAESVNEFIRNGWQPQGGVSGTIYCQKNEREGWWETHTEYSQAMVQSQTYEDAS